MPTPFAVAFNEDGDVTILGRITARNGSGSATGIDGEGNFLEQADISTIVRKTFDLEGDTTDPVSTSLTVSAVVLDTVVTANTIWTLDTIGYNFIDDVPASLFPTGGRRYRIEYVVTLSGGAVFHGVYEGIADPIFSS